MAIRFKAAVELQIPCIALVICRILTVVNSASSGSVTEKGSCELQASPDFVASMECRFPEPVRYMQMDFYRPRPTPTDVPEMVVSCGDGSCDVTRNFTGTLKIRGAPTNYTLTLKVTGVPVFHAGKYICLAIPFTGSTTLQGECSLRSPATDPPGSCELQASPDFVASMECRFPEPARYMQMDFYRPRPTPTDVPEMVVSCGEGSCDVTRNFTGTLKMRGAPTNYTLTLKVMGVPVFHAGKYRCMAQSITRSTTVQGQCSLRSPASSET